MGCPVIHTERDAAGHAKIIERSQSGGPAAGTVAPPGTFPCPARYRPTSLGPSSTSIPLARRPLWGPFRIDPVAFP